MPPGKLLLVRHGESEWNAESRWQGSADVALTDLGRRQAAEAACRLEGNPFARVVASDLARARVTAEILAEHLGLATVALDPGLRERDVGLWSGLTRVEIEARWPGALESWRSGRVREIPGGEPDEAFVARVLETARRVATHIASAGGDVLVVSHGGVIRALDVALGAPDRLRPGNLSGRWWHWDGELAPGEPVRLLEPDAFTPSPTP